MSTLNQVNLIGNLVKEAEIKEGLSGNSIITFTVATNHISQWPNGETKEEPEFHNCVAFGKIGDIVAKYGTKGQKVYVLGRIRTRSWDDQATWTKRYRTEIVVEKFTMLSKKEVTNDYSDLL